jgi:hypothetical protein
MQRVEAANSCEHLARAKRVRCGAVTTPGAAKTVRIAGRTYQLLRSLGAGGMGAVYETRDPQIRERRLALKMLTADGSYEIKKFEDEAKLLAEMNNEHLVRFHDFGVDELSGNYCYTMALIDGKSLAKRVEDRQPLNLREARIVFDGVLHALSALHRHPRKITHRDIKPANIMLESSGRPIVVDLGIARAEQGTGLTRATALTIAGTGPGTILYVAPEQVLGRATPRSDVFSLGLTIFEAISGENLYDVIGVERGEILDRIVRRANEPLAIDFPAAVEIRSPMRRKLQAFLQKACALDPAERFADAVEMRRAWRALFPGPEPDRVWSRRAKIAVAAGTVGVTLAAVAITWLRSCGVEQRVRALESEVLERERALERLIRSLDRGPVPASAPVRAAAQQLLDTANKYREDATAELAAANFEVAGSYLGNAARDLNAGCSELEAKHLRAIAAERSDAARARLGKLETSGVLDFAGAKGEELARSVADLAVPDPKTPPCEAGAAEFALIQGVASLGREMDEIETSFSSKLVAAVEAARIAADAARSGVEAIPVADPGFSELVAAGRSAYTLAAESAAALRQSEALAAYRDASRSFEEAQKIANRVLEIAANVASAEAAVAAAQVAARTSLDAAERAGTGLLGEGSCDALASPDARESCKRAVSHLAAARSALEQDRPDPAKQQADRARSEFETAAGAEAAIPKPPRIAKAVPADSTVPAYRNASLQFKVTASDVNGDALRYRWTLDGVALDSDTALLNLPAAKSGRVEVEVSDPSGLADSRAWELRVENRKPKLRVTPESDPSVEPGESVEFRADATDPDGDPVKISYRVDGREVGSERRFRYRAKGAGTEEFEIVATDDAGASTSLTRRVRISAAPADPGSLVRRALADYTSALNQKNAARLAAVFPGYEADTYGKMLLPRIGAANSVVTTSLASAEPRDPTGSEYQIRFSQREKSSFKDTTRNCSAVLRRSGNQYRFQPDGSFNCELE